MCAFARVPGTERAVREPRDGREQRHASQRDQHQGHESRIDDALHTRLLQPWGRGLLHGVVGSLVSLVALLARSRLSCSCLA